MAEPTFNASPQTVNGSFQPANDNKSPKLGSLNLSAMTSSTALAGTTGVDAKLIHGDRWQQIDGSQTETIDKDLTTDIKENETWTVHENYTMTVKGKTDDTRQEDVKETYFSESRFEYWLEHTDTHHDQDHLINPTHTFDFLNIEGDYKNVEFASMALGIETKGVSIEVVVAKAEAWGAGAEAYGAQVGAGFFENAVCANSVQEKASELKLKAMENEIKGLHSHIGGPKVLILPIRIGICIAIHVDSPFA
jgi:hypothetical protein